MPEELRTSLNNIDNFASAYNAVTNRANETVVMVEDFLERKNVGIDVDFKITNYIGLGYGRIGQRFRIAVVEYTPGESTWKPWADSSRELKFNTFDALPNLLAAIADSLKERFAAAQARVDTTCAALQAVIPKPAASAKPLPSPDELARTLAASSPKPRR